MISQTTTGPCLLIVDDDDSVREGFRWILQDQYRIIEAPASVSTLKNPNIFTALIRLRRRSLEVVNLNRIATPLHCWGKLQWLSHMI